jgi:hypothetical protein
VFLRDTGDDMFFEKTAKFDLKQYFDSDCPDVRVLLRKLYKRTKETVAREREINLEVVLLIGCLEVKNAAVNLGIGKREDLACCLGLTPNMYWKRAQAGRVLLRHPEFIDLIMEGKTHVSHIAILAPKLTEANKSVFLDEIEGKSERELREFAASVNPDGSRKEVEPTIDVKLSLSKSQLELLERSREVLSSNGHVPSDEEIFAKALTGLLERRDPMQKAERAEVRARKKEGLSPIRKENELSSLRNTACGTSVKKGRIPIPAHVRHRVYLRDGGRCAYTEKDGKRCNSRVALQIDHLIPVAKGGGNDLENLRLLCRQHNLIEGERLLGQGIMEQYRFVPH